MNLLYTIAKTVEEKQNSAEGHPRMATVAEITLRKILNNARIKPFQVSYYCEKRDPEFDAKMQDVLVIYKQVEMQFDQNGKLIPFEKDAVHTLSYDEKTGIQAVTITGEDRPPVLDTDKSSSYQRDYEYTRLGTLSLLAAIDLSKEDIDSIVYEVVNQKAASEENKNKRVPAPILRKRKTVQN